MELVRRIAERWAKKPERVVLVEHVEDRAVAWTGADFRELVDRHKARLASGVGVSRLGLCGVNSAELAAWFFAALELGVAVVPFAAGLPREEVFERARRFGVELVWFDDPGPRGGAEPVAPAGGVSKKLDSFIEMDQAGAALLLSTSGTTGEPRAVIVSRASLSRHTLGLVDEVLGLTEADRVLLALPLAHSFGCRMGLLAPLAAGAVVHLVARFSARASMRLLVDEGVTWAPVVPTMLAAWAVLPGESPSSLRWVLSAAAPLPDALRARATVRLGCEVREGYGLTEASFAAIDRPGEPSVVGCVGRATPGVEIRIDEAKEVQVRGDNMMSGYLDDPAGTSAVMTSDGWLRTGDIGRWEDGRLRIVDRMKDIILCGGFTVYPAEVERVISAISGVMGCAVFGLADAFLGERVAAAVVWRGDEDGPVERIELLRVGASEHVASYAVPTDWFFVDALPTGASGKVVKRVLRQRFGA